ncbi:PCI domain containing protein, putative [Babesia bigemina]|uniref:PCI domain containing protein, putative n=1 Tax=Babesia bigemina TaxID=5866 RepID=A0A061D7M1_BABBI|nr:PCI domain containing protein, putative [Babesia bigemina]CDR95987.1 PCI domain containing protein, putative [Babesia bigemina]|eukprot:XP_012768173.1 PCI domain containing protein, putative [Babesia bigemina]
MDSTVSELLSVDSTFRDEPRLEDLSDLASKTLDIVESMLKNTATRDVEFLKTVLLELMLVEKRCRMARDGASNARICTFIIQLLYDIRDLPNVSYYLILLSRKRGQLKVAITAMVNLAKSWIVEIPDMESRVNLIDTLSHITLGKMYLETQRAEVAFTLARIKEESGDIAGAANDVHNVEVDTFGLLPKQDKVRYLLEQMRLHLLNKDYLRFYITSKKINESLLDAEEYSAHKLKYYEYMIQYHLHEGDYFEIAKAYHKRMDTSIKQGGAGWILDMECMLLFLLLSPISEDTVKYREDILATKEKNMKETPMLTALFKEFLSNNLIPFPLEEDIGSAVKAHAVFSDTNLPGGDVRLAALSDRVVQHNILVVSKYYTNVQLARLSELLNVDCAKLEEEISSMVHAKTVHAKIDRPAGIIRFGERKSTDAVLNGWSKDIAALIGLVDQCSRLVQKEKMIHEARLKQVELEKTYHQ